MKLSATYRLLLILIGMLLMTATPLQADDKGDKDVLERLIQIPRSKETVYQLLGKVSERSGYLFIYDSKIIDNEQVVKYREANTPLKRPSTILSVTVTWVSA